MAQRYVTDEGVLVIPGAYPSIKVQQQNSGLATTGVVFLVGEANAGPHWSQELDLTTNFFAPTEMSAVLSKYGSGNIVDAFRSVANPANDTNIAGSPSFIYIIKTNLSAKAQGALLRSGSAAYGILADQSFGQLGNLLYSNVIEKISEVGPTTGLFTYIPGPNLGSADTVTLGVRIDGGSKIDVSIPHTTTPAALVAAINAVQGLDAEGCVDRGALTGITNPVTLALVAAGNNVTITISTAWTTTPSAGDTMLIPRSGNFGASGDSVLSGGSHANCGAYIVTAATASTIVATKLRDDTTTGVTGPVNVSAVAVGTAANDLLCYSPLNVKLFTGTNRNFLTGLVTKTVAGTASGQVLQLVLQTGFTWAALPQVNDLVQIPSTAPSGILASGANTGWYVVTAATNGTSAGATTLTMTRLSNGAPSSFGATALAAVTDIVDNRPAIDGLGKALELSDDGGGINAATIFFTTTGTPAAFLSTAGTPNLLTSASELEVELSVNRQSDGVSEIIDAGGNVVLLVGYKGTTASVTVTSTNLTSAVTGGVGAALPAIKLTDFKRLSDLAAFINSQTGWSCSVATAIYGQFPATSLDEGTYNCASDFTSKPARIKKDAYDFFNTLVANSAHVQLGVTVLAAATSGLPEAQQTFFLSGGAVGGTAAADALNAINALAGLRGNFVVPLFSRDATADITDGLTDASSTYTIAGIHAAVSSHVIAMSKLKTRRHRQGFLSFKGTFANAKLAAQNVANYRCSMTLQDVKTLAGDGTIQQFQPWMGAVLAAGMQAAGFYRSLVFKGINASGALMADGSFVDQNDADLEAAIENGLLAIQRPPTGGIRWNSDQTTYATDESFVYNSIQAIYASDTIALTTAQRMETAFVGQSVADVSASLALSFLQGIMADMKRLKLIAPSDDAPLGYRDAQIVISGNAMKVQVNIKLDGAILFIPITFLVTQVQQTAAQ